MRVGNEPFHSIYFCTSIKAIHRRAKQLFGLTVIAREESYAINALPKEEIRRFEDIIIEKKRRESRQDAWDIYYQDHWRGH